MGEITKNDYFGKTIIETVKEYNLKNILEIGSWDGTGSTQCFIEGMQSLKDPQLTCIEVKKDRYDDLVRNVSPYPWVKCYNESTISLKSFVHSSFEEVWNSRYNHIQSEREVVQTWYNEDVESIKDVSAGFLEKDDKFYDGILIDGSEFFGYSEFLLVKDRCNVLFLDDYYSAFKTRQVAEELNKDENWLAIAGNRHTRNGFAVFKRNHLA